MFSNGSVLIYKHENLPQKLKGKIKTEALFLAKEASGVLAHTFLQPSGL